MLLLLSLLLLRSRRSCAQVRQRAGGDLSVPLNFVVSAPVHQPGEGVAAQPGFSESPQTSTFVTTFGLPADFRTARGATLGVAPPPPPPPKSTAALFAPMAMGDEEIDLGDD